jgi:hypothetical protein
MMHKKKGKRAFRCGHKEQYHLPSKDWAEMIRKVYEIYPLLFPSCGGKMSIISFIEKPKTIDRIIRHPELPFEAERPPPPHHVQQELLMTAEDSGKYFRGHLQLFSAYSRAESILILLIWRLRVNGNLIASKMNFILFFIILRYFLIQLRLILPSTRSIFIRTNHFFRNTCLTISRA